MKKHDQPTALVRRDHIPSRFGACVGPYDVEELSELQGIVEGGPDWNCIEDITVTLNRVTIPGLTIENALGDEG